MLPEEQSRKFEITFMSLASAKFGFSWDKTGKGAKPFHFKGAASAKTGTVVHCREIKVNKRNARSERHWKLANPLFKPGLLFSDIGELEWKISKLLWGGINKCQRSDGGIP